MTKFTGMFTGIALVSLLACGVPLTRAQDDSADRGASAPPAATQPSDNGPVKVDVTDHDAVKAAVGKHVILEGTIEKAAWKSSGKVMKATFKGNDKLSLVVFQSKKDDLDKAFNGDLAAAMTGAKVQVSGFLKQFNSSPELIIDDAKQLTIVPAGATAGATTQSSQ